MTKPKKENQKENQKKMLALQRKYGTRITTARKGREAFARKDYINATKLYQDYLTTLAELKEVADIFKLTPAHFNEKKDLTEMLLISHVYWDLARINEMTPKLQSAFLLSINQFVKFTVNQPYQVLNAEMLRRYIKKNKSTSMQIGHLNQAYGQIFIESKKCYVATLCFGEDHPTTTSLRSLKSFLLRSQLGFKFIEIYYRISSPLVSSLEKRKRWQIVFRLALSPPLKGIGFLVDLLRRT